MAFNQFINAGPTLKLEAETRRRFVITGRASGTKIETIVDAGQSFTVTAGSEALRVDGFEEAPASSGDPDAIEFSMTE